MPEVNARSRQTLSTRFVIEPTREFMPWATSVQRDCINKVMRGLASGEMRLQNLPCPCGSERSDTIISEAERHGLPMESVLCRDCGTIRFDPYLDEASLARFYAEDYQAMYGRATDVAKAFESQRPTAERLLATVRSRITPGSRVFEVGCGAGGALAVFRDAGCEVTGCEFSPELLEYGGAQGLKELRPGGLADQPVPAPGARFDLIYMLHVFEHLRDPVAVLRCARERLTAGGRIAIVVPDVSRIHETEFPAGDLMPFLHVAHAFNYTVPALEAIARQAGLAMAELTPEPAMKSGFPGPELWIEFTPHDDPPCRHALGPQRGAAMLAQLQENEARFAARHVPAERKAKPSKPPKPAKEAKPIKLERPPGPLRRLERRLRKLWKLFRE
jgi:SAM-dependent methyltransferase